MVLGSGTDKRFFSSLSELLRRVQSGELGDILHLEAHFSNEVAGTFAEWRYGAEESPAGGMTGTGIHIVDALIAMAGPVRRVQTLLLSHKPPPDPLESLSVLLEFAAGISGTLATIRSTPGSLRVHPLVDSIRINLEAFADAVAGGAAYPISPNQMLDTVAAFEAIAEAVKSDGRPRQA